MGTVTEPEKTKKFGRMEDIYSTEREEDEEVNFLLIHPTQYPQLGCIASQDHRGEDNYEE